MSTPVALPIESWYRQAPESHDITLCDPFRDGVALDPKRAPYDVERAHGAGLEWMNEYGRYITWTLLYGMQDTAEDLGPRNGPMTFEGIVNSSSAYLYAVEGRVVRRREEPYNNTYDERIRQVILPNDAPAALPIAIEGAESPFERAMHDARMAVEREPDVEKGAIGELVYGHMVSWGRFARIGEQMLHILGTGNATLHSLARLNPKVSVTDYAPRTNLTRLIELTQATEVYASIISSPNLPENWQYEDPAAILETCRIPGSEL